jgi:uncharacterized protein YaaQ
VTTDNDTILRHPRFARERTADEERSRGGQKLIIMVVADNDAERLIRELVSKGYHATKIGSTGGFLRRGNTTIMSGVDAADVETVIELVRRICHARTELVPLASLPMIGDATPMMDPIEVRVGGAVIFVLNIERLEHV